MGIKKKVENKGRTFIYFCLGLVLMDKRNVSHIKVSYS